MEQCYTSTGLSERLQLIHNFPVDDQALSWMALASAFKNKGHQFCPDSILNDATRCEFNATCQSIGVLFDQVAKEYDPETAAFSDMGDGAGSKDKQVAIDLRGFCEVMINRFAFVGGRGAKKERIMEELDQPCYQALANCIGFPCNRESFIYLVRQLRIGKLLSMVADQKGDHNWSYYYNYNASFISGSTVLSQRDKHVFGRRMEYHVPQVPKQLAIGHSRDLLTLREYLFTYPAHVKANHMHWLHLQDPSIEMVMLVGQRYEMPGHMLACISRLRDAQSMVDNEHFRKGKDAKSLQRLGVPPRTAPICEAPPQATIESSVSSGEHQVSLGFEAWTSIVLPAVYIDAASKRSMQRFNMWFEDKKRSGNLTTGPPRIKVALVVAKVALMWSTMTKGGSAVISVNSENTYLGKWVTDEGGKQEEQSLMASFWALFSCRCCHRRDGSKRSDGYQKLSQSETPRYDEGCHGLASQDRELGFDTMRHLSDEMETDEDAMSLEYDPDSIQGVLGVHVPDKEAGCATFENAYERVLQQLSEDHSNLRVGSDVDFVARVVLNKTWDYLDTITLFEAALTRLQHLLRDKRQRNKDRLIARVSLANLELGHLGRLVQPLIDEAAPDFANYLSEREEVRDYLFDIKHNLNMFYPRCQAQIHLCETIIAEYDRTAADRVNKILNFLTAITFLIVPFQILTGLYGMNFKIMPELEWDHGYAYFYVLVTTVTIIFAMLLCCVTNSS